MTPCAFEKSFSSIKLLKIYNRSIMTNDLLNTFAMLNVHLNIHPTLEDVLRKFIAFDPHRLDFDI